MAPADFPAALIALRDQLGLSQRDASERMGITTRTLQRYESGESAPGPERAERFLERLRSDTAFPVKRHRRPSAPRATVSQDTADPIDPSALLVIPGGGEAGAGAPRSNDGASHDVVVITRAEVERVVGVLSDVPAIRWFTVAGDSCVPDFQPGERVYYRETQTLAGDGYHVVALDGEWTVKRVQRHGGGVLDLVPANSAYRIETLRPVAGAEPNTYRSDLSGATCTFAVVGKIVFNLHAR